METEGEKPQAFPGTTAEDVRLAEMGYEQGTHFERDVDP